MAGPPCVFFSPSKLHTIFGRFLPDFFSIRKIVHSFYPFHTMGSHGNWGFGIGMGR
jgi:hypothetical protein